MPRKRTHYGQFVIKVLLACGVLIGEGFAASAEAQGAAPPLWTVQTLESKVLGAARRIRVSLPPGYEAPENAEERYGVLISLDGQADVTFGATAAMTHAMAAGSSPAIPRLIVVGVETRDATRYRDTTPPFPGAPDGAGGAPAFLRFLSTELRPHLAARYRTNSVTVLLGHSMTALFTAWAFGQASDLTAAVAFSPSLPVASGGFARQALDGIIARRTPGRLFLAIGSQEGAPMVEASQTFIAGLNARPSAGRDVEFYEVPDASHGNTVSLGLVKALQFVFRPVSLAGHPLERSGLEFEAPKLVEIFEGIRDRYLRGTRQLGMPERLPLTFLRYWSRTQAPELAPFALRVCEELMTSYPPVFTGYECAADAQARLGRSEEAGANYRRGIDLARKAGNVDAAERIARKEAALRVR